MRANDKSRWHALVRQCRITKNSDEIGLPDLMTRKKAVVESTLAMSQGFGVRDSTEILWLTQKRYIAHQVYVEGIPGATLAEKEQAATRKWERDVRNPDIARRGTGVDTQLGVVGVPRTEGFRGRESWRTVTSTDTVHSKSRLEGHMKSLSEHGTTAHALTGQAMAEFGTVFVQGAASSSSDTFIQALPARNVTAPPASSVCDVATLEPSSAYMQDAEFTFRKRSLAREQSDPAKRARGGATGDLLVMRNNALADIKTAWQAYGIGRGNMAQRWENIQKSGHLTDNLVPAQMSQWLVTYKDFLRQLKTDRKKEIATWTLSSASQHAGTIRNMISSIETLATTMAEYVTAAEDHVKHVKKGEQCGLRKAHTERNRLMAPWRPSGVHTESRMPVSMLRYMIDNGLLIQGRGTHGTARMVESYDTSNDDLDEARPWVIPFSHVSPGKDIAMLRPAIGEKRIEEAMSRAETFMNEDGSRLMSDIRMKPMGGGHDHVEQLAWVPSAWKARSLTPEALRSLGTPWLLSHDVAGARKDGVQWPLAGFGHFLCVQRGDMLTCLIPATAIVDRGATLETCVTFLTQLSWKEFDKFMTKHCEFATLTPGRALWVPYGWRCILVPRTTSSHSHVLHIPYVNARMLLACPLKEEVIAFAKNSTREWSVLMNMPHCVATAREAELWLDKVGTLEDTASQSVTLDMPAIEDQH